MSGQDGWKIDKISWRRHTPIRRRGKQSTRTESEIAYEKEGSGPRIKARMQAALERRYTLSTAGAVPLGAQRVRKKLRYVAAAAGTSLHESHTYRD
jgi:hypothetical protein